MIGAAGSGKDSVCEQIVGKYGFKRIALADPLRDIVQLSFVLDEDSVWDRERRELPMEFPGEDWSVRKLLQYIGTEMFRNNIHKDTWVHNFKQRLEPGVNYVLTDVRFPNEREDIASFFGGKILYVEVVREGYDGKDVGIKGHESEAHAIHGDIIIHNSGTLEDLRKATDDTLKAALFSEKSSESA